jgi:hypothetical protein
MIERGEQDCFTARKKSISFVNCHASVREAGVIADFQRELSFGISLFICTIHCKIRNMDLAVWAGWGLFFRDATLRLQISWD